MIPKTGKHYTDKLTEQLLAAEDLTRVNAERIAEDWAMSGTTFRRRLRAEGTSFSKIYENVQMCRVHMLLQQNPRATGRELATIAGYTEVNAFYRAFRGWHGVNFSDYKRHRAAVA